APCETTVCRNQLAPTSCDADPLDGSLVGLAPRVAEEHPSERLSGRFAKSALELGPNAVALAGRADQQATGLLRDRRSQSRVAVTNARHAGARGTVDVRAAVGVVDRRALAPLDHQSSVVKGRTVCRLQFEDGGCRCCRVPRDLGAPDHGCRPADLVHVTTVPSPANARLKGMSRRASPRTTRATPPSSASPAPISFLFILPPA